MYGKWEAYQQCGVMITRLNSIFFLFFFKFKAMESNNYIYKLIFSQPPNVR